MTGPGDRSGMEPGQGADAPSGGFRKGAFGVTGTGDTSGFGGLVRVDIGVVHRIGVLVVDGHR